MLECCKKFSKRQLFFKGNDPRSSSVHILLPNTWYYSTYFDWTGILIDIDLHTLVLLLLGNNILVTILASFPIHPPSLLWERAYSKSWFMFTPYTNPIWPEGLSHPDLHSFWLWCQLVTLSKSLPLSAKFPYLNEVVDLDSLQYLWRSSEIKDCTPKTVFACWLLNCWIWSQGGSQEDRCQDSSS